MRKQERERERIFKGKKGERRYEHIDQGERQVEGIKMGKWKER